MSTWRVTDERPADFCELIYNEEDCIVEEFKVEMEEMENMDVNYDEYDEEELCEVFVDNEVIEDNAGSPEAPAYSPLTTSGSPLQMEEHPSPPSLSRDRSRSPILFRSSSESAPTPLVILRMFDGNGVPLDDDDYGSFLVPDAHPLYELEEREREMSGRRGEGRGGRRDGRRGRGRNARERRYQHQRRKENEWVVGHPLNEIWTSDADVPYELISMATEVLRKRQSSTTGVSNERNEREDDNEIEDEFVYASDRENGLFEWFPMESFQGKEEPFKVKRTGSVRVYNTAYDAFRSYWSDDIINRIVTETNRYAAKIDSPSFKSEWCETNLHEILCLFAFWMMLGIIRMPTVISCFSVDPLLKTEVFGRIFTRRRYQMLSRALHLVDSDSNSANLSSTRADPLHYLRPIITHLNSAFQSNYILNKDICIDESLTLWKGRLNFKQFIRNKASKYGIKTFELCESVTGYLWSFIVYSGKESEADVEHLPGELKSTNIVKKLIRPLLNKGYRLFMDNWYNSPLLARFLKRNGTDCIGTLRPSRRDVPFVVNKAPLKRGEFIARHSGDVSVLSWQDKKRVTMISTCHDASCALPTVPSRPSSRPVPYKPQMVLDYNKFMGGVDLKDQMLEPYLIERKRGLKWYMKLFKRLLNVSIQNSRVLLASSSKKHQDNLVFRLQLVDSILSNHLSLCPQSRKYTVSSSKSEHEQPGRYLISTHWPVLLEPTESTSSRNRNFWKRCFVCLKEGRKTQRTPYCCESCKVPLCIKNCFKSYHTHKK